MVAEKQTEYLPSIDGLRAIAVLAVILNHLSRETVPSGYLGVDIFFVISGFVITRSLMSRNYVSTTQFLLDFYARRMKRLLPALVAVVIVSGLLIRLFDPRPIVPTVTGIAALIGASNIFCILRPSTISAAPQNSTYSRIPGLSESKSNSILSTRCSFSSS